LKVTYRVWRLALEMVTALCVQFMQIMFCKQSTHIVSVHNIFMMCLVFMSLTNYVQLILYTDILMVILKLVFGTLSMRA